MRKVKVTARFIGENGSMHFKTGETYHLTLRQRKFPGVDNIWIKSKSGMTCLYGSFVAFLINWDSVSVRVNP